MPRIEKKSFIQKNGLIAIWAMAGFIAMGYIGFLVVGVEPAANRSGLAANQVAALSAKIDRIKHNELKLAHKLSNIEQSLGPMTASINPPTTSPVAAHNDPSPAARIKETGYGIDNLPATADMAIPAVDDRDGSTAPAGKGKISIKVLPLTADDEIAGFLGPASPQSYGLALAKSRSMDALRRHWDYLQKTSGKLLNGLEAHYLNMGSNNDEGKFYNLVAGPVERLSEARSICSQLTRLSIECAATRLDAAMLQASLHTAGK